MGLFDFFKPKKTIQEQHKEQPELCFSHLNWEEIVIAGTTRWCLRCSVCGRKRGNTYRDHETGQLRYAFDCDFPGVVKVGAPSGTYPHIEEPLMKLFYERFPDADESNDEEACIAQEHIAAIIQSYHAKDEVRRQENLAKPHCPTCNSTDVQPISNAKRIVSTAVMGIASSTIGKSYECKKCGYKW